MMDEKACCQVFDPLLWDERFFTFEDKLFVKLDIKSFFHIPLNANRVMNKAMKAIELEGALPEEFLMLADECSSFSAKWYVAVSKPVNGFKHAGLSGNFYTKVFEGSYRHMKEWIDQMKVFVTIKGKSIKKFYFSYPYCPKCAKKYGKNYVVIFAEV